MSKLSVGDQSDRAGAYRLLVTAADLIEPESNETLASWRVKAHSAGLLTDAEWLLSHTLIGGACMAQASIRAMRRHLEGAP